MKSKATSAEQKVKKNHASVPRCSQFVQMHLSDFEGYYNNLTTDFNE